MSSHHARQPQAALDILKHSVCSGLVGSFLSVQFLAIAVQQHELLIGAELLSRALTSFCTARPPLSSALTRASFSGRTAPSQAAIRGFYFHRNTTELCEAHRFIPQGSSVPLLVHVAGTGQCSALRSLCVAARCVTPMTERCNEAPCPFSRSFPLPDSPRRANNHQ